MSWNSGVCVALFVGVSTVVCAQGALAQEAQNMWRDRAHDLIRHLSLSLDPVPDQIGSGDGAAIGRSQVAPLALLPQEPKSGAVHRPVFGAVFESDSGSPGLTFQGLRMLADIVLNQRVIVRLRF